MVKVTELTVKLQVAAILKSKLVVVLLASTIQIGFITGYLGFLPGPAVLWPENG